VGLQDHPLLQQLLLLLAHQGLGELGGAGGLRGQLGWGRQGLQVPGLGGHGA
jgi:hypothetical protein